MNDAEFWSLIESGRRAVPSMAEIPKWLTDHLKGMPEQEIVSFEQRLSEACRAAYDERLWAAAIAISDHFSSDDVFADFRCWLVAQGKEVYEAALANPDSLADVKHIDGEGSISSLGFAIGAAAFAAYKAKTRRVDFSEKVGTVPPSAWPLKNENLWDGNPETLKQIVPRLCARFER